MTDSGDVVVALDVGGTLLKGAVVDRKGEIVSVLRRESERDPEGLVRQILDVLAELVALPPRPPRAVGLAVLGIVDGERAVYSSTVGWRDVPLRRFAAERTGLPVAFEHDVRAGAYAEAALGAGRGVDNFLFLPIGTSMAGTLVMGGRPYQGAGGMAGEIGHVVVDPGGRECGCGQRGCLDTIASGRAIAQAYGAGVTAEEVFHRAASGDAAARRVVESAVDGLASALTTCVTLLDPGLIVLGGGVAQAGDALFEPLRAALKARLTYQNQPGIIPATLGDSAGCLGAALLAWDCV